MEVVERRTNFLSKNRNYFLFKKRNSFLSKNRNSKNGNCFSPKTDILSAPKRADSDCYSNDNKTTLLEILLSKYGIQNNENEKGKIKSSGKINTKENDWNNKFQEILSSEESYQKWHNLETLAKDFTYVASFYGKIIISEYYLPEQEKTIRVAEDKGGVAGGKKYLVQNILFKFALDINMKEKIQCRSGGDTYTYKDQFLYGGAEANDEKAMKSATNEHKGLMAYLLGDVKVFHFPMLTLIHYKGFTVIASV